MVKKFWRLSAIVLCAALLLVLVAGCGSSSTAPAPASSAAPAASGSAAAPAATKWPEKAINVIVPFPAGGGVDMAARFLLPYVEKELGVPIAITNIEGGSGWSGYIEMLNAKNDGYTFSYANFPAQITGYMNPSANLPYSNKDFTYLYNEVSDFNVAWIGKDQTKFTTAEEWIAYGKEHPGTTCSATGVGSDDHVLIEKVNQAMGTQFDIPQFQGSADALPAIMGLHVDSGINNVAEVYSKHNDGELKIMCVFSPERSPFLPDVQTFEEIFGVPLYGASDRGMVGHANMDPAIKEKLLAAVERAATNPEFLKKAEDAGMQINMIYGDDFQAYVQDIVDTVDSMLELFGWR